MIERIKPGNPQQNGRHERMHLALKKEATKPAGFNILEQQEKFDSFIAKYNNERSHQAIGMKYPGELYSPSARVYNGLPALEYPLHDQIITVTNCRRICLHRKKINLNEVFVGQKAGIRGTEDKVWLVSFIN